MFDFTFKQVIYEIMESYYLKKEIISFYRPWLKLLIVLHILRPTFKENHNSFLDVNEYVTWHYEYFKIIDHFLFMIWT